jgi:hypothetical protein
LVSLPYEPNGTPFPTPDSMVRIVIAVPKKSVDKEEAK